MKPDILGWNLRSILILGTADCEKTTRTISKIPKDPERARASPKKLFFILVSEFGKILCRNFLEVVVSRILSFIFLIVGYRYNPFNIPKHLSAVSATSNRLGSFGVPRRRKSVVRLNRVLRYVL